MNEFAMFLESIKTAVSILNSFNKLKSMAEVQSKIVELNSIILPLQDMANRLNLDNAKLNQTILEQQNKILKFTEWESNKPNYKRITFTTGSTTYAEKENNNLTTGYSYFCQNCYDNRKEISVYQPVQAIFESMKEEAI